MTDAPLDDFYLQCIGQAQREDARVAEARPFIKWAGGKSQLLEPIRELIPAKIRTYFEPFLGGGAVFFSLAAEGRFGRAILNDWNAELIDAYRIVRDFPGDLVPKMAQLKEDYQADPEPTFYRERARDPQQLSPLERAARFLFLNRTAFNGMYRVNKKGEYNVPWGRYKNPAILNEPLLRACSAALAETTLRQGDFAAGTKGAKKGDFVYFDPPYVPINDTSNFTSYTSDGFGLDDQYRLAALFRLLVDRGVGVALSNSDTEVVRELYKGFEIRQIMARRNINSKGDGRGPVPELLVVGRPGGFISAEPAA